MKIRSSLFSKVFGASRQYLLINDTNISIISDEKTVKTLRFSDFVTLPTSESYLFYGALSFYTKDGSITVKHLHLSDLQAALPKIETLSKQHVALSTVNIIKTFNELAVENYLRDSAVELLCNQITPLARSYTSKKSTWHELLDENTATELEQIIQYVPIKQYLAALRANYEKVVLAQRQCFYDKIESNPLTQEQRQAVIRDNDRNLVLAAAGTGKTSVIVAKVLDLIDSSKAKPSEILVLAYNTAAAKELRERLALRAKLASVEMQEAPYIMTFHALGRMLLQQAKVPTYLSIFVHDTLKREIWLSTWLTEHLKANSKALLNFIEISTQPTSPFNFTSEREYHSYIRDHELRSLQDEKVDNYEELLIANWLFLNSIKYHYKPRFPLKKNIKIGVNLTANFYLLGTDSERVYLIKKDSTVAVKNNIEKRLMAIIKKSHLKIKAKPTEDIFQTLNKKGFVLEGVKLYLKCLQAIRTEQIDASVILKRLTSAGIPQPEKQTDFLWNIVEAYREELLRQDAIDFDDMIIRSLEILQEQTFIPPWSHILIDEFQDISGARMELIKALIKFGPQPRLTAVGDDWQAIYRFAGGKLELTTQFDTLVGSNTKTLLQKTFRYNNSIADVAGTFVMQNPEQFSKHIQTHHIVTEPQVYLLNSRTTQNDNNIERKVLQVVEAIRENDPRGSIAILGRYRYLLNNAQKQIAPKHSDNIKYWTFHGAKGLEADYCILIGFFKGKVGFPNQNKDDALLEALLPSLDTFPHSEERRLFYVALTRARKKSYIIADSIATSEFIDELLSPQYKIHVGSKAFLAKTKTTTPYF